MVFDKSSLISNIKAFTLFTAMVSFIVIGIGVLVIQHMSNSEHNYNQIINSLHRQQEMDSTKDLIRLDALKVFNVLYREQVYKYFDTNTGTNEPTTGHDYNPIDLNNQDWNDFVNKYVNEMYFGENTNDAKFAEYVAMKLISLLYQYSGTLKSTYFFRVFDYSFEKQYFKHNSSSSNGFHNFFKPGTVTNLNASTLIDALSKASTSANSNSDFYRLVDCPLKNSSQDNCKNGSFYTNLYFNDVNNNTYLNLPRVFIERTTDKSAMDDAILPKNIISQYIPLRLFGAIALARKDINDLKPIPPSVDINVNVTYGQKSEKSVDFSKGCKQFDGTKTSDFKSDTDNSNTSNDDITTYFPKIPDPNTMDNFDINLDKVTSQKYYTYKYIGVYDPKGSLASFSKKKVVRAKFYVSVTDKGKYSSFGHGRGMVYGFSGIKPLVNKPYDNLSVNIMICNCTVDKDSKLSCSSNPYNDSSTPDSTTWEYTVSAKTVGELKGLNTSGLSDSIKSDIKARQQDVGNLR